MKIELNDKQAEVIKEALDFYARLEASQIRQVEYYIERRYCLDFDPDFMMELRDILRVPIDLMVNKINSLPRERLKTKEAEIAWDMHSVIRRHQAFKREGLDPCTDEVPKRLWCFVDFDNPIQFSEEPLIKIEE